MTFAFRSVWQPPSQKAMNTALDDFAELLSTDRYTLAEIANLMGVSRATPCVFLHMIRERLGRDQCR